MSDPVGVVLVHVPPPLARDLAARLDVLATVDDPVAALGAALVAAPAVVVVDLAGPAALAAVALVSEERPAAAVLVVTDEPAVPPYTAVLDAVRAGATGYVAGTDVAEITDAVQRLAKGGSAFDTGVAQAVLDTRGLPSSDVHLTERETDVLRLVVEGLTSKQIATRLTLSPRTVENHVQHLQRKAGVRGRASLVRWAIEHGHA
jgi:DNA-binding NarL/FixJ family response regulator